MVKQVDTDASTAGAPAVLTFMPALFLELMELIFFKIKKIFLNMMGGFMDVVSSKAGDLSAIERKMILINNKDSRRRIFCLKSCKLEARC